MRSDNLHEEFAPFGDDTGMVARVESLPLASTPALACDASVGDFVRGQMGV